MSHPPREAGKDAQECYQKISREKVTWKKRVGRENCKVTGKVQDFWSLRLETDDSRFLAQNS
jgi:hypothetical protein